MLNREPAGMDQGGVGRLAWVLGLALLGFGLSSCAGAATAPAAGEPAAGVSAPTADASGWIGPFPASQGGIALSYRSEPAPVPVNQLHAWTVRLTSPDGAPVEGASIAISGGMPAMGHSHGLPTTPSVAADLGGGEYRIEGMKFQMQGPWEVYLDISTPDGLADRVTIPLDL